MNNSVTQNINGSVYGSANVAGGNIFSANNTIGNSENIENVLREIRDKVIQLDLCSSELDNINDDIDVIEEQVHTNEPNITRIKKAIENIGKVVAAIPYKKEISDFLLSRLEIFKELFKMQ